MKSWFLAISGALVLVCTGILLVPMGCTNKKGEGFAIYLTKEDIPPSRMEALSHIDIADQPIISSQDVVTYNVQTHELKILESAFKNILNLEVPVSGKSFVVCVNKKVLYWGAFWTPISSISFDGVTIWKPYDSQGLRILTLELGYPASSFYGGDDPRNSPEILESLRRAGKLVDKLSIAEVTHLPSSMKGYEIYSWIENDQWYFTLITGTNRNKTSEEIISKEDFISEAGWVKTSAAGADALKAILSKLPPKESILWLNTLRESSAQGETKFQLPPPPIRDAIQDYAVQRNLDFRIMIP